MVPTVMNEATSGTAIPRSDGLPERVPLNEVFDSGVLDRTPGVGHGASPVVRQRILDAFRREGSRLIVRIRSARLGGNVEELKRAAHALKSSSATIGAIAVSAAAGQLEQSAGERPSSELDRWVSQLDWEAERLWRLFDDSPG